MQGRLDRCGIQNENIDGQYSVAGSLILVLSSSRKERLSVSAEKSFVYTFQQNVHKLTSINSQKVNFGFRVLPGLFKFCTEITIVYEFSATKPSHCLVRQGYVVGNSDVEVASWITIAPYICDI